MRAGVWAVAVVAVAAAAPAAAASVEPLTWTWTASYVTGRQVETYFTATNPRSEPVDVVSTLPRTQGAVQLYGYGFSSGTPAWDIALQSTTIVGTVTLPAQSAATTPWIGFYTNSATTQVLTASLTPAFDPAVPFLSLSFS